MTIQTTKNLTPELRKWLSAMTKRQVLVGVPAENADRDPEPGEQRAPITNAQIGYLMETGRPEQNLPARPHLVPGIDSAQERIVGVLRAGAKKSLDNALQGQSNPLDDTLNKVGLIASSAVKSKITDGPFEELSERTLEDRKRRGRTGEKPLIDTGAYRNSITFVLRNKGK